MTLFEYVATFMAILIALAVSRSLDGLRFAFGSTSRYWLHATWVVVKLFNPINFWLAFWAARNLSEWTAAMFLLAAAWPALFYLQVTGLVTARPEEVDDWRTHFYGQRISFFALNLLMAAVGWGFIALAFGSTGLSLSVPNAPRVLDISGVAFSIAVTIFSVLGVVTDKPRVHAVIAVVAAMNMVIFVLLRAFYVVLAAE